MKKILFFHGFGSAASSGNAIEMRNSLYEEGVEVKAIDIPIMPVEAIQRLKEWVAQEQPDLIVGTSMGAMYAEQMKGIKRILVNPSFDIARNLTFSGMGRREFRNKREDGAKDFKVDKEMIAQFRTVQKDSLKGITPQEKELVWGLFGRLDKVVNYQKEFQKAYGKEHFIVFEGEHYLNGKVLSHTVLPLVRELLAE
ncbi:MAG: YqiA/YcfP family alpha/beta fold hydrolase [Bacteroidaceae bacterium]|nr:YqiA/YcfP family alpha/beta fold hydrolase [Bacteroidaceae bacterium]